jgi:hypothetical protein
MDAMAPRNFSVSLRRRIAATVPLGAFFYAHEHMQVVANDRSHLAAVPLLVIF